LGAVLTALDYSAVAERYFVPRTTSAISQLMHCWTRPLSPRSTTATIVSLCVNIVLLTTMVAVDVCTVMRREGKGRGQVIDPQCIVYTAPIIATGTDTGVVCQTKHRHRPSCKFLPP